jgi:hypothetical protein
MQNDTSRYLVNIVPLQNIQSNTSALDSTTVLTNDVTAIKKMINTDTKRVYANSIASFTTGGTIQFASPTNLSGVSAGQTTSSIGAGMTSLNVYGSNGSSNSPALQLTSAASSNAVFTVTQGGDVTMGGTCYAQQFVTLSDIGAKTNIRGLSASHLEGIGKLRPYIFNYVSGTGVESIGLLAQEVSAVYPQLIQDSVKGSYVNYNGVVAVLVGAVNELAARVSSLEGVI